MNRTGKDYREIETEDNESGEEGIFSNKKNYRRPRVSRSNCVNPPGKDVFKDDTESLADELMKKR